MGKVDCGRLLNGGWQISNGELTVPLRVPGDVHSALLTAGEITDPYWRAQEVALDWVHETEWTARKTFAIDAIGTGRWYIRFACVDTVATVYVNDLEVAHLNSQYLRHDVDVTDAVTQGENDLRVVFHSNSKTAAELAENDDITTPYIFFNNRIGHYNQLRKAHCHAGWDWNIAVSPLGFYDDITLIQGEHLRLDDVMIRQSHSGNAVDVEFDVHMFATAQGDVDVTVEFNGDTKTTTHQIQLGDTMCRVKMRLDDPELWWPVGQGDQPLYPVRVTVDGQEKTFEIGLRSIDLVTEADEIGQSFAFKVNGRDVFMRGANWIPADALPERGTPETVRDILQSAVDANMNMIRVWGGGQYEADWFYDLCAELGILVWHDFMFACSLYPAHNRDWLDLVRREATQQIRRLSRCPAMALWCGDNEVIGALTWYDESKADRDRYLAIYARLNAALEDAIEENAPDIAFWPSSPSVGRLNFGDGWHDDRSGDMHFWDVWHSAKDFEHYRTVKPRFCSEFGFQSFPSNRVINSFSEPQDRNVSSEVMEVHQRNEGGNARIVETIQRYFRFPDKFEDMVWLSQVSQSLAMKTSIEFWRSNKPRCNGTLYWQLNDTWPVASWSGLDYGGGWKLTHYHARRFFAPVLITAQPDATTGDIVLWAVNDTADAVDSVVSINAIAMDGKKRGVDQKEVCIPTGMSIEIARFAVGSFTDQEFLHFSWENSDGSVGENEYFLKRPKLYDLPVPNITVEEGPDQITLTTDLPAFYVTVDHGGSDIWSDNGFMLLPDVPKTLTKTRERGGIKGDPDIRFLR